MPGLVARSSWLPKSPENNCQSTLENSRWQIWGNNSIVKPKGWMLVKNTVMSHLAGLDIKDGRGPMNESGRPFLIKPLFKRSPPALISLAPHQKWQQCQHPASFTWEKSSGTREKISFVIQIHLSSLLFNTFFFFFICLLCLWDWLFLWAYFFLVFLARKKFQVSEYQKNALGLCEQEL